MTYCNCKFYKSSLDTFEVKLYSQIIAKDILGIHKKKYVDWTYFVDFLSIFKISI